MKFEHLVQINDPSLPGVDWLTRQQLWFGLVARAWKPTKFILGLQSAEIVQTQQRENVTVLKRVLDYGPFKIEDTTSLHEEDRTETTITANEFCGNSTLTICIEEPEPGELWLRFNYDVGELSTKTLNNAQTLSRQEEEVRKQAYRASDIDTVRMIRELALTIPPDDNDPRKDH
jgi:hypothetical protein